MQNTLFVVSGMPATGKTTFARQLAARLSAVLVDIDTATEPLVQVAMKTLTGDSDDRDSPVFKENFRDPVYDTLFAIASDNLAFNHVALTGPFTKESAQADWLEKLGKQLTVPCRIRAIYLQCSSELRRERIFDRGNPRDRSKLEDWEKHEKYYQAFSSPRYPHLAVDSARESAMKQAVETLRQEIAR